VLKNDQSLPQNALTSLENCSEVFYPNVNKLLTILATLPVTTASAERSFSTLRRLKTYLRSTMTDDRLTSLALLNIHHDITITSDEVLDQYCRVKNRKLCL
jgi:hAT family C-terminal dimerisation region